MTEQDSGNRTDPHPADAVKIRRAVLEDLRGLARVHVDGWKTTYRGMVPDEVLDHLTIESDIAAGFGEWLKDRRPEVAQFVALSPDQEIIGYARACPNGESAYSYSGELEAIYVLKSYQGRGVGTALVRHVARFLVGTGRTSMIVWVLPQNPYRRFYERLGGAIVGERVSQSHRLGVGPLPEVGYGWRDIRPLAMGPRARSS
jgi:GNAT superfamily N-acetyltransferase